ncbi:hypothetical protein J6590_058477 [Homalodisca vitripennis]|nr:hypothetical protein J6590_058477 [Homalodisca vitripennis]
MWTVDTCCCCFSLRTGCLIIGVLQLMSPSINVIGTVVIRVENSTREDTNDISNTFSKHAANSNEFWASRLMDIFQMSIAIVLICGVVRNRKRLLYYYVFVEALLIVIRIFILVILLTLAALHQVGATVSLNVISWALLVYFIVVVYSYQREMSQTCVNGCTTDEI